MSKRTIECYISEVLNGDARENALKLVAHIRVGEEAGKSSIVMNDEKDESGWNVPGIGFIVITGSDDFPGPWTMWMGVDNLGEGVTTPVDESLKELAWSYVSPCGSCGGSCTPGARTTIFGRVFENTCQSNLMFTNPDAGVVEGMIKIIDMLR